MHQMIYNPFSIIQNYGLRISLKKIYFTVFHQSAESLHTDLNQYIIQTALICNITID